MFVFPCTRLLVRFSSAGEDLAPPCCTTPVTPSSGMLDQEEEEVVVVVVVVVSTTAQKCPSSGTHSCEVVASLPWSELAVRSGSET